MITAEQIKELVALEVKRILHEEVTLEYDSAHWMNDNTLRIDLMMHDETISSICLSKYDLPQD